ncbi:MAG: DNA gyrase inhibitor YacG [Alphaproteobacteria bacterium]
MKKCIECGKNERSEQYKPFCSKRCADVDLHKWNSGSYAIPTEERVQIEQNEENEY